MRQVEVHADTAFNASWHEARATSKEEGWTPPAGVTIEYTPQAVASYKIDEQILLQMVEERKGDPREAQRLLRCAQPHAGGFVTAVPSKEDGNDAIMRPHLFRTAVQYRLGIPLLKEANPLSFVHAAHPTQWRPRHLLRKLRGSHHSTQCSSRHGGWNR